MHTGKDTVNVDLHIAARRQHAEQLLDALAALADSLVTIANALMANMAVTALEPAPTALAYLALLELIQTWMEDGLVVPVQVRATRLAFAGLAVGLPRRLAVVHAQRVGEGRRGRISPHPPLAVWRCVARCVHGVAIEIVVAMGLGEHDAR